MNRKRFPRQVVDVVRAQLEFLQVHDPTNPLSGGVEYFKAPMAGLPYRLYPEAIELLTSELANLLPTSEHVKAAINMATTLSEPGTRKCLIVRFSYGNIMSTINQTLGDVSQGWHNAEAMAGKSGVQNQKYFLRALGQICKANPDIFKKIILSHGGKINNIAQITQFIYSSVYKKTKTYRNNTRPPLLAHELSEINTLFSTLLSSCEKPFDEVTSKRVCLIAAELHENKMEIHPFHLSFFPVQTNEFWNKAEKEGSTLIRRAMLLHYQNEAGVTVDQRGSSLKI